jgi:hypothetical protein
MIGASGNNERGGPHDHHHRDGQDSLREYTIRYRVVPMVDGQGEPCTFCQLLTIQANVYARLMNGDEAYEQTCLSCVLPVLDGHLDTDPSYIVTIEQPQ